MDSMEEEQITLRKDILLKYFDQYFHISGFKKYKNVVIDDIIKNKICNKIAIDIQLGIQDKSEKKYKKREIQEQKYRDFYDDISRRISLNLDPDCYVGNTSLISSLLSGKKKGFEVADMKMVEINPDMNKSIFKEYVKREYLLYNHNPKHTTMYKCPKCKERKSIAVSNKQFACSDESGTTLITCLVCGFNYKQSN